MSSCPFCNEPFPRDLDAEITAVDGNCPSHCDTGIWVEARCPNCRNVFWRKRVNAEYVSPFRAAWKHLYLPGKYGPPPDNLPETVYYDDVLWEVKSNELHIIDREIPDVLLVAKPR